jgi:hypothetical protein
MQGYIPLGKRSIVVKPGKPTIVDIGLVEDVSVMPQVVVMPSYFGTTKDAPVSSQNMDIAEINSQPSGNYDIQRAISAIPAVVSGADTDNEIIVRAVTTAKIFL